MDQKMFVAAAEESQNNLVQGRGDAYCGMLNASYNLKTSQMSVLTFRNIRLEMQRIAQI